MIGGLIPGFIFPADQARLETQNSQEDSDSNIDGSEINNDDNFSL